MALVWGYDGTGFTAVDGGVQSTGGIGFATNADNGASITAVGTGSVATAYLYVSAWSGAGSAKIIVYDGAGSLVAVSDAVTSAAGTGLLAFTFASPFSVLLGQDYYGYVVPNTSYVDVRYNDAAAGFSIYNSAITYSAPESTVPTPSTGNNKPFILWFDSSAAGNVNLLSGKFGGLFAGKF